MQSARIKSRNSLAQDPVIPAQAGIQLIKYPRERGTPSRFCPLRGLLFLLDSGLRRNDGVMEYP
jgi:hypothetical protein